MDTKKFKSEFGNDLTIRGGSCDNQFVMLFGTPQQIRDETRRRIEDLATEGGFIFASIHLIQNGLLKTLLNGGKLCRNIGIINHYYFAHKVIL
jgi:hypothetical protein